MKPRVLLIQRPVEDFYTTPIRLYPLGLLYVAAILRKFGMEVKILDSFNPLKKRKIPLLRSHLHFLVTEGGADEAWTFHKIS